LQIVDERLGAAVSTIELPDVDRLKATSVVNGDLYATSRDGNIERLVPR
jgi:hypothetical protein